MAQGQIDQILSSKPEERRAVFEEAAGITKYKSQRREALNKLSLTEQNLARVADVIGEVARQIGSLRRQAAKAMRYRRLHHRLRHLSLAWSGRQHAELTVDAHRIGRPRQRPARPVPTPAAPASIRSRARSDDKKIPARPAQPARAGCAAGRVRLALAEGRRGERRQSRADQAAAGLEETGWIPPRQSRRTRKCSCAQVGAQFDTGAQDKQLQLGLLGSSDAVFQQRNRELAIAEGELSKLEAGAAAGQISSACPAGERRRPPAHGLLGL